MLKPNCFTAFYILQTVHFCFSNLRAYLISSGEWEKCSVAIKLWYCGHSEYFMDSGFIFIAGETIKLIDCPTSSWIHLDWLFTFFVESKKIIKDKNKRQSGQNFASIYFFTKQCWKTKKYAIIKLIFEREGKMKEKSKCGQEQSKKESFRISYARACLRLRGYCSISTMKLRFFGTNSYLL